MPSRHRPMPNSRMSAALAVVAVPLGTATAIGAVIWLGIAAPNALAQQSAGRLVYTRAEGEWPFDIYVSDADGTGEMRLTADDGIEYDPRWSADGSEIAFHVAKEGAPVRILRMPGTGGTPTPVITDDGRGYDAGYPAWHPQRDCLAYAGDHPAMDGRSDLKIWCAGEGSRVVRVTDARNESSSDWSPDGSRLVVESEPIEGARNDRSYWDIYVMAIDGSEYEPLVTAEGSSECDPRWSPDGSRVAFVSYFSRDCAGAGSLRVLDLASGTVAELVTKVAGPPTWAPDGRSVAVTGIVDTGPEPGPGISPPPPPADPSLPRKGIYRVDLQARALLRLEGAAGGVAGGGRFAWGFGPDWWGYPPTATPTTTPTPTVTPTATETPLPTPTPTRSRTWLVLPVAMRGHVLVPATRTPPATPTADATSIPEPGATSSPTADRTPYGTALPIDTPDPAATP